MALLGQGCGQKQPASTSMPNGPPTIRARILAGVSVAQISASEPPLFQSTGGAGQKLEFPSRGSVALRLSAAGWKIGDVTFPPGDLTIEPAADGSMLINQIAYHGTFHLLPVSATTFDVVNHVDIDAYLKGVLAKELFPDFAPEAYKAQAVVARTYALFEWRTTSGAKTFDVHADTRSQMYGGIAGETAKSRAAVDETRGVVVAYGPPGQERIFKAYFSACCGGAGQSAAQAFGDTPQEPLTDHKVGRRCAASPRFDWGPVVIAKDELTRRFRAFGKSRGRPRRASRRSSGSRSADPTHPAAPCNLPSLTSATPATS